MKRIVLFGVGAIWLALILFCLIGHFCLFFNNSPSFPIGFYWKTSNPGAPYALVCLSGAAKADAVLRGLPAHGGACPDGTPPLLKKIYPEMADILLTPEGFYAGGIYNPALLIPNTRPRSTDLKGCPLTHYPYGLYKPVLNQVWILSDWSAFSYDSRYFGPVQRNQIISYAHPFLTAPWLR
jgi:type IV secretory pathway protease TraF